MKKRLLLSLTFLLVAVAISWAQRTVSGTIIGDDGEPLIGASVLVKGTSVGAITDIDGSYELVVPEGSEVLLVSYTGFETQEMTLGASNIMDVTLNQGVLLDEAVVTALGISRSEKSIGYAIQEIDGESVQQVSEPDPIRALQGKVAGVNIIGSSGAPGSATRITIRGNSSLTGNNQPLIVVDGIPFDNSSYRTDLGLSGGGAYSNRLADIDPNNIESINVLRGAAAAALWGSRAANGVIMVKTKSGSNKVKKGLGITLSSAIYAEQIANLPDYQNSYGTGTNFNYQQANGSWGAPFVGARPYATLTEIPHWYSGRVGFDDLTGTTVPYRAYPDNVRNLFQTGITTDNSVTISSGGENTSLSTTISYLNNDGYVPNTNFNRFNFSVGGSHKLSEKFTIGGNLGYTRTNQDGVISGVGALGGNNPSAFARALYLGRNWDVHGQPFQNPIDMGSEFMVGRGQADNPLWSYENSGITSDVDRITAVINGRYELIEGLGLNVRAGTNAYSQRNQEFIRPGSTGPSDNAGVGQITDHNINFQEIETFLFLDYTKQLSNSLSLTAAVGNSINQLTVEQQAVQGLNFGVFDEIDLSNVNNVIPYNLPDGINFSRRRLVGVYGDFTIGYDNWLYLNVGLRNDWSSTLPTENNSFMYPSASISANILDGFNIEARNIDFLKLRAGVASVGNSGDPYLLSNVYLLNSVLVTSPTPTASFPFTPTVGPSAGNTVPALTLSDTETDPNLVNERTEEYEFGVDLRMFKGRVTLDATYYNRRSFDQIGSISIPNSTGFEAFLTNFGEVRNEGYEVALGLTPVRLKNSFQWETFFTFTQNDNEVLSLRDGIEELTIEQGSGFANSVAGVLRPGEDFGVLLGTVNVRDDEGNLLINPADGQLIRAPELDIIGNPNPDFRVGFINTFSFKGLSLRAVFDWQQGGDLFSNTVLSMLGRGVTLDTEDREVNKVIPGVYGDPNTLQPILDEGGNKIVNQTQVEVNTLYFGETFAINGANEWNVYDATYIKLREITLAYTLNAKTLQNTPLQGATIALTGRNLWVYAPGFPEHTNFDPEVSQFADTNKQGIEYSATPAVQRWGASIRLNF